MEQREDSLGHAALDGPRAEEMWSAIAALETLYEANQNVTPSELHTTIQLLSGLSDQWVDPEVDPIGDPARTILEEIIHRLGKLLDDAVPEAKDSRQRYEDLRLLSHCVHRKMRREELNPSALTKLWRRITGRQKSL
jgi:hypothetical protein